jgi:bacteriocin-like protein
MRPEPKASKETTMKQHETASKSLETEQEKCAAGRELTDEDLAEVSGGLVCRKAGKDQQEYLTFNGSSIIAI